MSSKRRARFSESSGGRAAVGKHARRAFAQVRQEPLHLGVVAQLECALAGPDPLGDTLGARQRVGEPGPRRAGLR